MLTLWFEGMKHNFNCTPLHTLSGNVIALDLTSRNPIHRNPEAQLLSQLEILANYADPFCRQDLLCCLSIDFGMAAAVLESPRIQLALSELPFVRLKLSENFPNLHDGLANPLLRALAAQINTLWLGDLGAGGANLHALQSKMFQAVKLDRDFYLKNVNKPTFSVLIAHIHRYTQCVIVNGAESTLQTER